MYFCKFSSYYTPILIHQYIRIFFHIFSLFNKFNMLSFSRNKYLSITNFFPQKIPIFSRTLSLITNNCQFFKYCSHLLNKFKSKSKLFKLHIYSTIYPSSLPISCFNESSTLSFFYMFMESFILFFSWINSFTLHMKFLTITTHLICEYMPWQEYFGFDDGQKKS